MTSTAQLSKKLTKVEKELDKWRAKEYALPFGSSQRAKASVNWDYWSKEKFKLLQQLEEMGDIA